MKAFGLSPISLGSVLRFGALVALVCGLLGSASAQVISNNKVKYSPFTTEITPLIPSAQSFVLTITSPPPGSQFPITVPLQKSMVSTPPSGLPLATALSYVTFAVGVTPVTSLTFTGPNQEINVTVTLTLPEGAPAGFYGYKILTTGWTASPAPVNDGAFINATASVAGLPPPPAVVISTPVDGSTITVESLPTTVSVNYTVTSTGALASVISASDVDVGGVATTPVTSSGLNTTSYTSVSTISINAEGEYAVTARGTNLGGTAVDVNKFTVLLKRPQPTIAYVAHSLTPGGAIINLNGTTLDLPTGQTTMNLPYRFDSTSNNGFFVDSVDVTITNGVGVTVATANLGTPAATTTGVLNNVGPGTYTLTATCYSGGALRVSATTSVTFTVRDTTVPPTGDFTISGIVFLDLNRDGVRAPIDPGLGAILVKLIKKSDGAVLATTLSTVGTGSYSFAVAPGAYEVDIDEPAGTVLTTVLPPVITITNASYGNANFGLGVDLSWIAKQKATGYTIGFWKNNIEKRLSGKGGTQAHAGDIDAHTTKIRETVALTSVYGITDTKVAANGPGLQNKDAVAIMGTTSSAKADLLSKQLLGSEYNYANGAFIGGSEEATRWFITWGEHILANAAALPDSVVINAQKWFDKYNNSHGGVIGSP